MKRNYENERKKGWKRGTVRLVYRKNSLMRLKMCEQREEKENIK